MRLELLTAGCLSALGCFVGGTGVDDAGDEAFELDTTDAADEPGCLGCPCDDATLCEPKLVCAEVCLPPDMVLIPAGPFPRGCEDAPCDEDEAPLRMISVSAFALDVREVTVADYLACATATRDPCLLPAAVWDGPESPYNFGAPDRDAHPVNGVTWEQAAAFCERQKKRLPTEAEWEKAACGATGERYPWGSSAPTCERANLDIGGPGCGKGATIETGQLAAGVSPYQAFDLAGNVAEWVQDYYAPGYYADAPGADPPGPESGHARGLRGGSWLSAPTKARASARGYALEPSPGIGFRCVRSIP